MSDNPQAVPKRRKRSKGFWSIVVIAALIIGYPLSFGPVCWVASWIGYRGLALCFLYRPLRHFCTAMQSEERKRDCNWTDSRNAVGGTFYWYCKLFASKGWDWRLDFIENWGDEMWSDRLHDPSENHFFESRPAVNDNAPTPDATSESN